MNLNFAKQKKCKNRFGQFVLAQIKIPLGFGTNSCLIKLNSLIRGIFRSSRREYETKFDFLILGLSFLIKVIRILDAGWESYFSLETRSHSNRSRLVNLKLESGICWKFKIDGPLGGVVLTLFLFQNTYRMFLTWQ